MAIQPSGRFTSGRGLSLALGALTALTLLLSFVNQWFIVTRLGAGAETDAIFAGLTIPQLLIAVGATPLLHVLVPLFAVRDRNELAVESWTVLVIVSGILTAISVALFFLAPLWVPLLVPGFTPSGKALTVSLTRVQVFAIALQGASTVLRSLHNVKHRFLRAAVSAVISSAFGLAFLVAMLPRLGASAAAWSFTLRSAVELVLLIPIMGPVVRPVLRHPVVPHAWRRFRPLLVGASYDRTELALDRLLSSLAPAGQLSLLSLAQQVFGAISQILNRSIADPVIPRLAQAAERQQWEAFQALLRRRVLWIGGATLAVFVGLVSFGQPLLRAVFEVRNMGASDVHLLWLLMILLVGLLIGDPMANTLSSAFYATTDTLTPTKIGIITYTAGIGVKIWAFTRWGVFGIAVGASAYYFLRIAVLYVVLRRRLAQRHSAPADRVPTIP